MTNICKLAVAVLAAAVKGGRAIDTSNCAPLEDLGTSNLDRFDYSIDMDVDDQCSYALSLRMKHDPTLPVPGDPSQCDPALVPPALVPPALAPDGLPYFAFRWAYEAVPDYVKRATGIDHISIDFNPCGHPPVGVFTVPHYDIHIYLVDSPYRSCMTCDTVPGAPVCDPANQSTPSGKGENCLSLARGTFQGSTLLPSRFLNSPIHAIQAFSMSTPLLPEPTPEKHPTCLMVSPSGLEISSR